MPIATFKVKSVSEPERRKHRTYQRWFKVWTIERERDDRLPISESLAAYDTMNEWHASLCERAMKLHLPVTVLWKDSPWLRQIVEITLAEKEQVA